MRSLAIMALCLATVACSQKESEAKKAVSRLLFDPSSAEFRDLFVAKSGFVCGEVNGKNRFRGYVGFRPFFYDPASKTAELDPQETISPQAKEIFGNLTDEIMDSEKFAKQYSANCAR